MLSIYNKFNIIKKLESTNIDYESVIQNYIENYIDTEINIYHPDYIYQIIWNNKIDEDKIKLLFDDALNSEIIKKKQNIKTLINKNKFSLNSLYQLLYNLNFITTKLKNILCISNNNDYMSLILLDPSINNYLQNEFANLDSDNINNIKKILDLLNIDNYDWFLKVISSTLKDNIPSLSINIPDKYKYLYDFKNTINYVDTIEKAYIFLKNSINILVDPIYTAILKKLLICIKHCNIIELLHLVNHKFIKDKFKEDEKKIIIDEISNNFINNITNIELFDYNKMTDLLKLMIKCKDLELLENYILLIFDNKKVINMIFNIIHNEINNEPTFIKNLISILLIKNKDEFIIKYHELLIQRILSNETNIVNEQLIINELYLLFGPKLTNKLYKVINDYINSNSDLENFKENIYNFDTITTSYSNWNINYNQGYVNLVNNNQLSNLESYLVNYQEYYSSIYNQKRKLLWLLQYGEVEITFNDIIIKLLPIQLMVLELFNLKDEFNFEEIYEQFFFANYSNKFKQDIINSLIKGNILIENNNKLYLNNTNISTNLIDIFLNDKNEINNVILHDLAHEREDIVKTLINHNLKINSMYKDTLFRKLENDIKLFKLTSEIYENTVNKMIKYDYITLDNNILLKCIY